MNYLERKERRSGKRCRWKIKIENKKRRGKSNSSIRGRRGKGSKWKIKKEK